MSLLQQDSRGHLTFMAVNREIPKYLDATLWSRGFPAILTSGTLKAGNGMSFGMRRHSIIRSKILAICRQKPFTERLTVH